MTPVLQLGDRTIAAAEVLPLLADYQIMPLLIKEIIIDQAIAQVECTPPEAKLACEHLAQQYQLTSEVALEQWLQQTGTSQEKFEATAIRQYKLEKFKEITWGADLDTFFFQNKSKLNRVVYSLIRTTDIGIAQEIYFRIQEGEQTFAELAREYSQGPEAETDGLIGPVELQTIHPILGQLLSTSQPQQLLPPVQIGDLFIVVRLEKSLPAKLDRSLRQRLMNERFNHWLQGQIASQKWQIATDT
jgi:parvulin-like peptidyl-prolyl isomerase